MQREGQMTTTGRQVPTTPRARTMARTMVPPVDVFENQDEILLFADLPGVTQEGLNIELDRNELRIEGYRTRNGQTDTTGNPDYRRTFMMPDGIDPNKVNADLKHGVLRVKLAKSAQARARRIEVKES